MCVSAAIKVPDEICADCGKVITRRAIANLIDGRTLCTPCYRRITIKRESDAAAAERKLHENDPTDRQLAFAEKLGLIVPRGVTKWQLSDMLDEAIRRKNDSLRPRVSRSPSGCLGALALMVGFVATVCWAIVRKGSL